MTARKTPKTAGKRLISTLNRALAPGAQWLETEQVVLDLLESTADRAAVLQELFDVETSKETVSTRRVTELAAEIRQLQAGIAKMIATLVPDPAAVVPKSRQHQKAAMARWR